VRSYDDLGLGAGLGFRGCNYLTFQSFTTGNCQVAGVSIEVGGQHFNASGNSKFAAPGTAGIGLSINSPIAAVDLKGVDFHRCVTGIKVIDAYSLTIDGATMYEIGRRSTNGTGIDLFSGDAVVAILGLHIDPQMHTANSILTDYGVRIRAAFTGTLHIVAPHIVDMQVGDIVNEGTAAVTNYANMVTASPNMTPAQFDALVGANDVVWVLQPFSTTWATTGDLSAYSGKTIIFMPSGEAMINSTASPILRVGGTDNRFGGKWWIKGTGASVDQIAVEVASGSYRHYWDHFKPENVGIGMQGTKGVIREIVTQAFEPKNVLSYGRRFYSYTNGDEIGLIVDRRIYEQTTDSDADNCIMYSMGPNVGSGGLIGLDHGGGLYYGGKHFIDCWATEALLSASWAANVVTFTTEENHGVPVGGTFVTANNTPSGYDGTWVATSGTTGKTLKAALLVDPGANTVLGSFTDNALRQGIYDNKPASIRLTNVTRRGGTHTSFKFRAGGDVMLVNCKSDDAGTSAAITAQSWSANVLTFTCGTDRGVRVGDYFYVVGSVGTGGGSAAYNGTFLAIAGTTGSTIKATSLTDPGASTTLGTLHSIGHGFHFGPDYQGMAVIDGGQVHESNGNGIRWEAAKAIGLKVKGTEIWNSSYADQAGVWSGYYQDLASSNVHLDSVTSGTGDHWRRASRTITFSGLPIAGETITFNGTAVTFRATASLQNEVTIGADAAATAQNLVDFINANQQSVFTAITATLSGAVVTIMHYPGATYGNAYTLTEAATNVAVSGSPLSAGTGNATQKYGFENIAHGRRNCSVVNCNGNNNITGAFSLNGYGRVIEVTDNLNAALRVTQLGGGPALVVEDSTNPDATPFVIDNAGRVVSGYTAPLAYGGNNTTPRHQIVATLPAENGYGVTLFRSTITDYPTFNFGRARGSTVGTYTAVVVDTVLGGVQWQGADGTGLIPAAEIKALVDGTPGTNDMPGRLVFSTTKDGEAAVTDRWQIGQRGILRALSGSLSRAAPVTKTADFTVADTENWLINNKSGSSCTVTLPAAASYPGREIMLLNYQAQTVISASSNVVPLAGGAAGTAILAATAGKWCTLVSDATNWLIMKAG
jgi:hypothetical protein